MPHGNHHMIPSGIWYENPSTTKLSRLLLKSGINLVGVALFFTALYEYRSMAWRWTFNSFVGNTRSYGTITTATHEPASVEYIDQLKREMAEKKRATRL